MRTWSVLSQAFIHAFGGKNGVPSKPIGAENYTASVSGSTLRNETEADCAFCVLVAGKDREIIKESPNFVLVFDNYPVNWGHILIISKRHIEDPFDMLENEAGELMSMLTKAKDYLQSRFRPAGYNIGVNCGEAAGQTVPHLHVHLIPRYPEDVEDPRGGVRNLKPALIPY